MGFYIARLKSWLGYENITANDLNAEFNNIINKAGSDTLGSANSTNGSAPTVAAMQTISNPGGIGSENLALTNQQDIQQLRFMLEAVIGGTQWYELPTASLDSLAASIGSTTFFPPSRVVSGRIDTNNQPMYLVPNGASTAFKLMATATNFVADFNSIQHVFSADISSTVNTQAAGKTCLVNDVSLTGTQATKTQGERTTQITIDTVDAAISALQGKYAAFKTSTEYFLAYVDTNNNRLIHCFRGIGFDSADAWSARVGVSDNQVVTLVRLSYIFATFNSGTPGVDVVDGSSNAPPIVSAVAPAAPTTGDYWYDLVNNTWEKYNGASFVSQIACFAGIVISDSTNAVLARSADFGNKVFSALNTLEMEFATTVQVQSTKTGAHVSVYGNYFFFDQSLVSWNTGTNMDTGVVLSANTKYACYIKDIGGVAISDIYPTERKFDLYGGYHPAKPWRCVGEFTTQGASLIVNGTTLNVTNHNGAVLPAQFVSAEQIRNLTITAAQIAAATITTTQIAASAGITGAQLAVGANITGSQLSATAGIVGGQLANTTVTASKIANATITGTQVAANIDLPGGSVKANSFNVVTSAVPATNGLRLVRGEFDCATGTVAIGEGFTVVNNATGDCTITFGTGFLIAPIIVAIAKLTSGFPTFGIVITQRSSSVTTARLNIIRTDTNFPFDATVDFIAIGES